MSSPASNNTIASGLVDWALIRLAEKSVVPSGVKSLPSSVPPASFRLASKPACRPWPKA